jgi:hypothetical protein
MRLRSSILLALPVAALFTSPLAYGGPDGSTGAGSGGGSANSASGTQPPPGKSVDEILADLPASCAFECGGCAEPATPYASST